ncbi:hypothetical protein [Algoriphagus machipongonensis]|uniref:Uncharacterized protein n=1 Tax=Algoriphagus machipongonensis TaxID=388413 RepID=A3I0B9_9BACT|nr:hypothetical protein [Algoriphagus machipongonensis]EAZ79915.1 hypothetical protein ALPR1_14839 [Algoriphagus machipongonensis]
MKIRLLIFLMIVSSLFGYLEWGGGNHSFLFQVEGEFAAKLFVDPKSVLHPLTVFPIIGQILLLITVFQAKPNRILIYIGIAGLGLLIGFMCFVGLIGLNMKIVFSTIPFLVLAIITIRAVKNSIEREVK